MKKATVIVTALFIVFIFVMAAMAQEVTVTETTTATETTGDISFGMLRMGQDNLYLCDNDGDCYLAIGGGFDIAQYTKAFAYGGSLELTLHATAAARVTGNDSSAVVGGSLNVDIIKLITGTKVNILLKELSVLIGPSLVYDANKGRPAYGGLLNFSYSF